MISLTELLSEAKLPFAEDSLDPYALKYKKTLDYLKTKNKVLCLTTSNRWVKHKDDVPKSSQLALKLQELLGKEKVKVIDITKLKIFMCEGNVSSNAAHGGNHCGVKAASLNDKDKDPMGTHRCWSSLNNPSDELYKVTNELLTSDAVVFFVSVRWGQTNAFYQKLIERLTWLENRHTALGESNLLKDIDAGLIAIGQNWNGKQVVDTQKKVLEFYGFKTPSELFWNWQYTSDSDDESLRSYQRANKVFKEFENTFLHTEL